MGLLDIEDIATEGVGISDRSGSFSDEAILQVKIHHVGGLNGKSKKLDSINCSKLENNNGNGHIKNYDNVAVDGNYNSSGVGNDLIAGNYLIFMKTWGCAHNSSDSEYMAGILAAYGFKITDDEKEAHVWILNSCTVKGPAEQHFKNYINNGLELNKKVILAGCVPQADPRADFVKGFSIIGVQQIDQVIRVVEDAIAGNTVRLFGKKKFKAKRLGGTDLSLPKIRKNPLIEIIPISTGCLNHCTYCKTKLARGELGSYPEEEIVARAVQAFAEGVREVWLTSEDTGAYGIDLGTDIVSLLRKLISVIPPEGMLRVGMTNPPYILNHLDDIAEILDHPRVYSFLHVPVQSGSDCVLSDMKREYCVEDFQNVVDVVKSRIPNCTIATDIICGFPTETKEDFEQTMELCRKNKFKILFINQFYPRQGTIAARWKRIDTVEVKRRTKLLAELFNSYLPYENRIGEVYDILVTEISHDKKHFVGHNKNYEQVLIEKHDELMGKHVKVKITSVCKHSMTGQIINESQISSSSLLLSSHVKLLSLCLLFVGILVIYFQKNDL